jgi:hypothetical protein
MSYLVSIAFGRLCIELKMVPMPTSSREPKVSRAGSSGFLNEHIGTTFGAGLGRVNAIASLPQGVRQLKRDARLNDQLHTNGDRNDRAPGTKRNDRKFHSIR